MTTQVQIRGASSATQNTRTLTSRELDVDTTNKRLAVHDGTTPGGIKIPNMFDVQNNPWTTATTSGTNTYTISLAAGVSLTGYAAFQRFSILIGTTNTGASSLDVDSNGVIAIKKIDGTGSLVDVVAGDLVAGNIYDVMHDGTYFQLMASGGGGSGKLIDEQFYTSSTTWTKPAGCMSVEVEVIGPGSGGSSGNSGSGGGYAYKRILSGIGSTESVIVGASGVSSSFGSHCSATAGTTSPQAGGSGIGGDLNIDGQAGGTTSGDGCQGGDSPKGFGCGGATSHTTGNNASGFGAGGGGANVAFTTFGHGTPGLVIVRSYN